MADIEKVLEMIKIKISLLSACPGFANGCRLCTDGTTCLDCNGKHFTGGDCQGIKLNKYKYDFIMVKKPSDISILSFFIFSLYCQLWCL